MALEAIYRLPFDERVHTLGAAQKGGDIVETADGYAGIVLGTGDYANGDIVRVAVKGIYEIASASATTFSAGDLAGWDDSAGVALAQSSGDSDFDLGTVVKAKTNGQLTVWVSINDTKVVIDTDT